MSKKYKKSENPGGPSLLNLLYLILTEHAIKKCHLQFV